MAKKSKPSRPTKPRRAAPAPRPRRAAAKAPSAPAAEPEVLGCDDEFEATIKVVPPEPMPRGDEQLDPLFERIRDSHPEGSAPADRLDQVVIACYAGDWTPKRELVLLKAIKADGRFVIEPAGKHKLVGIRWSAPAAAGAAPAPTTPPAAAEPPAKTLGEHVADQKGRPQRIAWPHDVGSRVLLLTPGYDPRKARIRNIADHGSYCLYDLDVEHGGTCDQTPADRIGRDIEAGDEVERLKLRIGALERHADRSAELAQAHVTMAATEHKLAEQLKEHRAAMAKVADQLAEHARSEPGQTDLRDIVGSGEPAAAPAPKEEAKKRGKKMAAKPAAAEDKLADAPPTGPLLAFAVDLHALGLTVDQLLAARFERATASTGKPQQVKPVELSSGRKYVVSDVQAGVAVLLPVISKKDWAEIEAPILGQPMDLPSSKQSERLAKRGALCGMPVKVGRATCYLGEDSGAVLVRLPAEEAAGAKPIGKDAAAGT